MSIQEGADEFLDKMIQQGIVAFGTDFASRGGDGTVIMKVEIVDGEPHCKQISEEDFYGWPIETLSRDEMRERFPALIEFMTVPHMVEQVYSLQKQAREDIDRVFYPRIERTHPTSPRKSRK